MPLSPQQHNKTESVAVISTRKMIKNSYWRGESHRPPIRYIND
jgi:hypothetical protein